MVTFEVEFVAGTLVLVEPVVGARGCPSEMTLATVALVAAELAATTVLIEAEAEAAGLAPTAVLVDAEATGFV